MIRIILLALFVMASPLRSNADNLPLETIPKSETLPASYPDTWVFAHDFNFYSLVDGKIVIVDVAADNRNVRGIFGASGFASFQHSRARSELYSAQTFYSRGTYGERTDVVVIVDPATLKPVDEIVLPPKRLQVVTQINTFQLTDGDRIGLVMNFTPAASVSVLDMAARKFLAEVPVPGCNFIFPTGKSGFSTLCADGSLASYTLAENGEATASGRTKPFIDIDNDPLFAKNAVIGGITYFPSFHGRIQPVDFRPGTPQILADWNMVPEALRKDEWRPSGWQVIAGNDRQLFVLMQAGGKEGSHKDGGTEVWVYEPVAGTLERRIRLSTPGISIAVTSSTPAYLVVTNSDMLLDVYDAASGDLIRTISIGNAATPMVVQSN